MPIERNRATSRMLALTALALAPVVFSPAALAQAAGSSQGLPSPNGTQASDKLEQAKSLVTSGRLIQARAVLSAMMRDPALKEAPADVQSNVLNLWTQVEKQIRTLDPLDASLQKATLALDEGDFVAAERHASAVSGKQSATPEQRDRAQELLKSIQDRRNDLSPMVANAVEQIATDFETARYSQAKGGIQAVRSTGVTLTEDQMFRLERYQDRILKLEAANGRIYPTEEVGLAIFQPGVVRRDRPAGQPAPNAQTPQPAQPETPAQPEPQPTNEQPPSPPPAPAPQPEPAPAPAAQPQPAPQEELITQALRVDAQSIIAEADRAFDDGRWNVAQEKYAKVLSAYRQYLTPDQISHAESRMAEAAQRLNQGEIGPGILQQQSMIRDATRAEFENAMAEASKALEAGDVAGARTLVAGARLTYGKSKQYFNPQEQNDEFVKPLSEMSRRIETVESQLAQNRIEEQTKTLAEKQKAEETRAREEKTRRIAEEISRARALQQEQKYDEALEVVDHILFLDSRNPAALLLRDTLRDIATYQKYWEIQREKHLNAAQQTLEAEADMIPPKGIMDYPNDWPVKSFERGDYGAFADTPENKKALAKLDTKIPVNFRDNTVADILKFVTQLTDVPIDPEWDNLRDVGVNEDTTVNYSLSTQLPAHVVLDRVLGKVSSDPLSRAGWAVSDGVVRVADQAVLNRDRTLVLYDIQDLLFDIPNFEEVPQIDLQSLLQQSQSGGGGGGQSPFRDDQQRQQGRDPNRPTREDRINLIRQIITSNVDPEGWVDNGGEVGTIQELNGSLIINNTPKNHREIVGLLSKLRQIRSMQINVETKFLLVNQSWFEQIGFDVDLVINSNSNVVRTARATDPNLQPTDLFDFTGAATGRRGLQRHVVASPMGATVNQPVANPQSWSPIGALQDSLGIANNLVEGDWASGLVAGAPALGIAGQFLDDIQVDFLITATQADKRTVQLTAPRLTFTNGQTANIFVVTQQAFVSDLQPVVGDSAVGFDPTVAVASEGVTMLMEGVISADRRYVTLNVDAGVGRIDGFEQQPVTAVAGGQLVNSAESRSFIQLPTITVTRVRTSVTVPDEGTVLLGGQRLITELEIETGVPVLSKIPIINRFFTNRIESKEEQTLLILVKPTVLIQAEQEEKNFPGLADSLSTGLR